MLEVIAAKLTGSAVAYAGGGIAVVASAWVLKKIPNSTIIAKFGGYMYKLGICATLGMAKWKWTKKVWNKTVEPYIIDAIDNILITGLAKFIEGMRSDNES